MDPGQIEFPASWAAPEVAKQHKEQNENCDQGKAKRLLAVRVHCHGVHSNQLLMNPGFESQSSIKITSKIHGECSEVQVRGI
jgi:hypothetical protein